MCARVCVRQDIRKEVNSRRLSTEERHTSTHRISHGRIDFVCASVVCVPLSVVLLMFVD